MRVDQEAAYAITGHMRRFSNIYKRLFMNGRRLGAEPATEELELSAFVRTQLGKYRQRYVHQQTFSAEQLPHFFHLFRDAAT